MNEHDNQSNPLNQQLTLFQMIKNKLLHDSSYVVFSLACILSISYLIYFIYYKIEVAILIQLVCSLSYIVILHDYTFQEKPNEKEYFLLLLWMILVNLLNHFFFLGFHLFFHFYVGMIAIILLIYVRDRIFLKTVVFLSSLILLLTGILVDQSTIPLNPLSSDLLLLYHQISDYSFYLLFFIILVSLIIISTSFRKTILILKEEKQALIAERNFLFGATAHELRSFLHSSNGLIEHLMNDNPNHLDENTLKQVLSMNQRMLLTANQMLETTKTVDQVDTSKYQPYDLRSIVDDLEKRYTLQFQKKRVVFFVLFPTHYESMFLGNESTIYHIVNNLLQNALKYTKFGKVSLTIIVVKINNRSAKISISVEDTGIGIAKDELEHIFEPWIQLKHKQIKLGYGFGLYIVHTLAKSIGAMIRVTSEVDKGSKFTLEFNQEIAHSEFESRNSMIESEFPHLQAMIVDDNPMNNRVLETFLSKLKITVKPIFHQDQFISEIKENQGKYDIIFMDYDLGETNGVDLIRRVGNNLTFKGKRPFVFLLTGISINEMIFLKKSDNIDKILYKPISFSFIQEEISQFVKREKI